MALTIGFHQATLIPPLQLTRGDSGEGDHIVAGELSFHREYIRLPNTCFKQMTQEMFETF
jgi:hypothetical protein